MILAALTIGGGLVLLFKGTGCKTPDKEELAARDTCAECHTSPAAERPSAFVLKGNSETQGAHKYHLNPKWTYPIPCTRCHGEINTASIFDHMSDSSQDVILNGYVAPSGQVETYDAATLSCAVMCHPSKVMRWDIDNVDHAVECLSCHREPEDAERHDTGDITSCRTCHPETMQPDGEVKKDAHVNGALEVRRSELTEDSCIECHEEIESDEIHSGHLETEVTYGLSCTDCHSAVGGELTLSSHPLDPNNGIRVDASRGIYSFNPSSEGEEANCTTRCHPRGVMWWRPTTLDCASCHRDTEPAHDITAREDCHICHEETVSMDGTINKDAHLNWTVEVIVDSCVACHTMPPETHLDLSYSEVAVMLIQGCENCHPKPATPFITGDTHRNGTEGDLLYIGTSISDLGALCYNCHTTENGINYQDDELHREHTEYTSITAWLNDEGRFDSGIGCMQCHNVTSFEMSDLLEHPKGSRAPWIVFGERATKKAEGAGLPVFTPGSKTCSNTNCHDSDNIKNPVEPSPKWELPAEPLDDCLTCHPIPPRDEFHSLVADGAIGLCGACHTTNPAHHIDEHQILDFIVDSDR